MKLPKLYKQDSKGSIREWQVSVEGDTVIVAHGLQGGSIVEARTVCKPKNVGRANATTAEEQALAEAQSKWVKQVERQLYTENEDGLNVSFIAPMLARDYTKVGHQLDWFEEVFASPKLDGARAIYSDGKLISRKGTEYTAPSHLLEELEYVEMKLGAPVDGEVYLHGYPLNQILSATKKKNELTPRLEFHIFDFVSDNVSYADRILTLQELDLSCVPHVKLVEASPIAKPDLDVRHDVYVAEGYEGLILRAGGYPYEVGVRSKGLMKYKKFLDSEFLIVDITPDVHGKQGILQCATTDGKVFGARSRGTDAYRESLLQNKEDHIGKMATIRYFTLTEFGIPQFPVAIVIGDQK